MPSSSIFLLFSIVFSGSNALPWTEAQQTHVYEEHPWSPRPTIVPTDPARLFKRDSVDPAICGWIGGNSASAATCSFGSTCVHDTIHGVVGCCATSGPCTAGVYTSCIDMNSNGWTPNSGLQDNGIYTCSGTAVCYKNTYAGGYYQYGCGESSWATTVETTYSGQPTDMLLQQVFTGIQFTPTTAPTTTSSSTSTSSSRTTTSSSSSTTTSTSSSSSKSSSTSASSTLPTASKVPTNTGSSTPSASAAAISKKSNTGAVIGGVIGGVAGLAIIGAALFWFLRRKQAQKQGRAGPFISAHNNGRPPTSGPFQRIAPHQPYGPDDFGHTTSIVAGGAALGAAPYSYADGPQTPPLNNPNGQVHHQFYAPPPAEEEPLVSEIDDFSRNYHRAIATVPTERDTHIHTGDLPDAEMGMAGGLAAMGVSPLRRSPTNVAGAGRTQDRDLTSEALRTPVQGSAWGSSQSTSNVGESSGNGSNSSLVNRDPDAIPPRSPLREGMGMMSGSLGSAVSAVVGRDNAPRYQLVDEARDLGDVPVLSGPGQLRQQRMSRNSNTGFLSGDTK